MYQAGFSLKKRQARAACNCSSIVVDDKVPVLYCGAVAPAALPLPTRSPPSNMFIALSLPALQFFANAGAILVYAVSTPACGWLCTASHVLPIRAVACCACQAATLPALLQY